MKYKPAIVAAYFKSEGLPPHVTEHQFHAERKWRFDFAWLEQKVALEVEGGIWIGGGHSRPSAVKKDMEKYNAATLLDWKVLRCEPKELCTQKVITMLRKVLK